MIMLHLGKVHRGTSKNSAAFLEVLFSFMSLCFVRLRAGTFLRGSFVTLPCVA